MLITNAEVEPIDKRFSIGMARHHFFEFIRKDKQARNVLKDLANQPLKWFVEAGFSSQGLWPITLDHVRVHGTYLYFLRNSLLQWAARWHLDADWCLEKACWTLETWKKYFPPSQDELDWGHDSTGWMRLSDDKFEGINPPFGLRKWGADVELLASYEKYAKEEIVEHINQSPFFCNLKGKIRANIIDDRMAEVSAYCNKVLDVYFSLQDDRGNPTWKRAESRDSLERNLKWAVKIQVLGPPYGITYSSLAKEEGVAVSTVVRAVDDILNLIGLPKRTDLVRGRRLGSKEAKDSRRKSLRQAGLSD